MLHKRQPALLAALLLMVCIYLLTAGTASGAGQCGVAADVAKTAAREFASDNKKGLKLFIKAKKLCPDDPQYDYNLGLAYYQYGQPVEAVKQLKKAVAAKPTNSKWLNNLAAMLLESHGDLAEAVQYARQAVQYGPSLKEARVTLVKVELAANELAQALEHADVAKQKWPSDEAINQVYQTARDKYLSFHLDQIQAGKISEGLAGLEKAENTPVGVKVYAISLAGLKRYEEALTVAQQGQKRFPGSEELATLFDDILDEQIRGLFLSYKSGKQAESIQAAKNLHESYPTKKNAKDAYDKLFAAFISDVSDVDIPDAKIVATRDTSGNSSGLEKRLANIGLGGAQNSTGSIHDIELHVDVDVRIPEGAEKKPYAVAVVIGNQRYSRMKRGISDVNYAERDARIMKKYLQKVLGYEEKNIIYFENTTSGDLRNIFGSSDNPRGMLQNYIRPGESEVFIYYSGHGAPGSDGTTSYLVPVDAQADYIANNGYDLDLFYRVIKKLPANRVTVVIDSCFSGDSEAGQLFTNISPAMLKNTRPVRELDNAVIFASADKEQVSTWYPEKRHSTFSYFFFKGIGGAADRNNDKIITVGEMDSYLSREVKYYAQRISNRKQTPLVVGEKGRIVARLQEQ